MNPVLECAFLNPGRVDLPALRALIDGARDAKDAWHRLAASQRIPTAWIDDPARRFVRDPTAHRLTRDPALAPHDAHPCEIDHCAMFASDVAGVLTAESDALALAERLAPWGTPPCTHVVWWTIPRAHYGGALTDTRPGVNYALPFAFNALGAALKAAGQASPRYFAEAKIWARLWNEHAARGTVIADSREAPRQRLAGRAFAELPNPFEPLAAIEAAGYATLEYTVTRELGGAVFLVAPSEGVNA